MSKIPTRSALKSMCPWGNHDIQKKSYPNIITDAKRSVIPLVIFSKKDPPKMGEKSMGYNKARITRYAKVVTQKPRIHAP
jgi:hypothetical protein